MRSKGRKYKSVGGVEGGGVQAGCETKHEGLGRRNTGKSGLRRSERDRRRGIGAACGLS